MEANAITPPIRLPVLPAVRLGGHRYFPAIPVQVRASLLRSRLALNLVGAAPAIFANRRTVDARPV